MRFKQRLTCIHCWIGEHLDLTHYRNCHSCVHRDESSDPDLIWCDLYLEEDGVLAATDPCEAVWCYEYEERDGQ